MSTNEKEPIFLEPHFTHNVWGGSKLRTVFGYDVEGDDIGECWGIAAHPNGKSLVKNGLYKGMGLDELYKEHGELFGVGARGENDKFPLLTKIIDAKSDLSIQVHPDDEYAKVHENGSLGKQNAGMFLTATRERHLL